ncbi:MAG TPA: UDP-N-acetylmuramoyl-L-alanyl-D-glutamate--2,6-diaminopimelate ligase, partial [Gallionella sp.]
MNPFLQLIQQLGAVTHLVTDSRSVKRGDTFVAYPGEKSDGRQFIAQAIAQGAGAVIYEKRLMKPLATRLSEQTTPAKSLVMSGHPWDTQNFAWNPGWNVPNLAVSDLRHKAGWLADAVYGAPSEHLWMVGVTGTNGKTSTCHWIAQALNDAAKKCALIGTLGNGYADALQASANTTPDAIHVHGLLADYLRSGAQAVAMEVSSHALAQERVNGVKFDVALLTNLTRDHLDYHGDMESYAASKRRLFDWQALKFAVVNLDDAFGADLALQLREQDVEVIGYGLTDAALQLAERQGMRMVHGLLLEMSSHGLHLEIHSSWGAGELRSALVGRFNAANLLGALAVLLVSDVSFNGAVQSLSRVQPVAGRMQKIGSAGQPAVIVDYAHTPDALEKVLLALREACLKPGVTVSGKLICVFGCGGDRDRGKRAMMGLVAEKYSDFCIVTSDNPRSEDADQIIREVVSGMALNNHEIIINRAAAIERAIGLAQCGDTVLVAGKGHEDYQEINGVKHPFSDVLVAMQALKNWSVPDGT